jgi:hypothetical protein
MINTFHNYVGYCPMSEINLISASIPAFKHLVYILSFLFKRLVAKEEILAYLACTINSRLHYQINSNQSPENRNRAKYQDIKNTNRNSA